MRLASLISAAFILCISGPALAQGWMPYVSLEDGFSMNFPGQPTVQDITYPTEHFITLPGRVHSAADGANRYSVTVVDYRDTEKIHSKKVEQCRAEGGDGDSCQEDWWKDVQGAIVYASWNFIKREGAKVTHYSWYTSDHVVGHWLQLTNADQSRTFATIHMHDGRLYIVEAAVAPGLPPPVLFQQSLGFVDKAGKGIRYRTFYTTGYGEWSFPAPPPSRSR